MSTFVWLMRTWLRAVGGQTPKVLITDEGKSLEEAITEVFPNTRHCFCLWNVLRKVPENLGHVLNRPEVFCRKFNKCIYRSWTQEEFEKKWWKMMDKFELREDEWLQSLYAKRTKWVPAYMSGTFLAGLCTGERSECSSSSFDKYLQRETSCKDFMDRYKLFLHDRSEEEAKADCETHHKSPTLRSLSPFEKQMSTVYTRSIFKKFQVEVLGTDACRVQKTYENEAVVTYQVNDFEEQQSFIVAWNEANLHVSCLCRSFEYRGFLCRHALIVLQMSGVSNIPPRCILRRWTNDANIRLSSSETSSRFSYRVQRFNDLCKRAIKLGEEGSLSQERYNIVIEALQEAMEHCVGLNASVRSVLEPNMSATQGFISTEEENQSDSLAKASKKKKIHKKRKVQSETEVIASLVQDCNLQMGMLDSGAHIVDNTCVPQQHMPGMGQIHSSSLIHNGYYSNQQGTQGMGQSNSIAMHIGHYGPQQSLQGLLQGPLGFRAPTIHGYFNIQDSLHDVEQSVGSRQFHDVRSKRLHDKHLPR